MGTDCCSLSVRHKYLNLLQTYLNKMNEDDCPKEKSNILRDLHFVEDIKKKIAGVKKLNDTCIYECKLKELVIKSCPLTRAANYVGYSSKKEICIATDYKSSKRAFDTSKKFKVTEWWESTSKKEILETFFLRLTVDRKLRDLYLVKRILPCTEHLKQVLRDLVLNEVNIIKCLENIGYFLQKVPGTNRGFIVEQYSSVKERFTYLQRIIQYREEGRNFVYIDKQDVTKSFGSKNETLIVIAVSPKFGLINHAFFRARNPLASWQLTSQNWLKNILLPTLPDNCVIVMDKKITSEIFLDSNVPPENLLLCSKTEMIAWLKSEGIPHRETMHKAELYELIETHKHDHNPKFEVDAILDSQGISVLRRPSWLLEFDFFCDFWKYLQSENFFPYFYSTVQEAEIHFVDYVKQYPVWNVMEMELAKKEKLFMDEDGKIENMIENVMLMSTKGNFVIANELLINQLDLL